MISKSYFPYRAFKNRPYVADFLSLPPHEREWSRLVQMALSFTRRSFGERDALKADLNLQQRAHVCSMHESWLSTALADFFNGGQVVFHISASLKDAFRNSDLGDATASDLKLPFENSYIHIGSGDDLFFNDGRAKLEGVFLAHKPHKDGDSLSLTLVGSLVETPAHWGERGMETFTFHFGNDEMNLTILEGAQKHLEREGRDPADDDSLSDLDEPRRAEILAAWAAQAEKRRITRKNIPVVLECVRMVANALLYVSQYPDDMVDDYQDDFPIGFKEKIERSQGKALERNLSKARNSGFTLIKRVGSVFEQAMQTEGPAGESPSPHMRRAHWRRQAHGAEKSQRKLIWIRASRVLGGTVRERPYLVSSAPA